MGSTMTEDDSVLVLPEPLREAPVTRLTKDQAEAFAAFKGFLHRYHLVCADHCMTCFRENRPDGCDSEVTNNTVRVRCRCENRQYRAETGTDLPTKDRSSAFVLGDMTDSCFELPDGRMVNVPARQISHDDAKTVRRMQSVYKAIDVAPHLYHKDCWNGLVADGNEMIVNMHGGTIVFVCNCRTLFYKGHGPH